MDTSEAPQGGWQIFAKMPTGKTVQIEIDPAKNSCFSLKPKITQALIECNHRAYEPTQQILSFSGTSTSKITHRF